MHFMAIAGLCCGRLEAGPANSEGPKLAQPPPAEEPTSEGTAEAEKHDEAEDDGDNCAKGKTETILMHSALMMRVDMAIMFCTLRKPAASWNQRRSAKPAR